MANINLAGNANPQTGSALTVTAANEIVFYNNSMATLTVTLTFDPTAAGAANVVNTFVMQPKGAFVSRPGAAGSLTPVVEAHHTGIAAADVPQFPEEFPTMAPTSRLVYQPVT